MKVFYKLIVSLWVCVARYAKDTQNNKFTISLQYLKENVKDEVNFLPADKCQRFLQTNTIILGVCGQVCPSLLFLCNILRIKGVMKLVFCMQISKKACYELIL